MRIAEYYAGEYEKYGYYFWKMMKDVHSEDSRIFRIDVRVAEKKVIVATEGLFLL